MEVFVQCNRDHLLRSLRAVIMAVGKQTPTLITNAYPQLAVCITSMLRSEGTRRNPGFGILITRKGLSVSNRHEGRHS